MDHRVIEEENPEFKRQKLSQIVLKALRCFGYGFLLRFAFSMLAGKFRITRVLSWGKGGSLKGILRFALMAGLFSFAFKFSRYLLDKLDILKGDTDNQVFIGALFSSLTLFLLERRDLEILKVLIFPRAVEAIYALLVEKGYIKPIPYGETLVSGLAALAIAYSYIYEPANISYSFVR
jgi:hypothetical protein